MSGPLSRRTLLSLVAGLAGSSLCARRAGAVGQRSRVRLAQLLYTGGNPDPRPGALRRLAWEVEKRTSIEADPDPVKLGLKARDLFAHPFLVLCGDSAFAPLSEADLGLLRRYLVYGGFLCIDSADARPGGAFDEAVRQMVLGLFPKDPLARLPDEHTLYKSFYLIDRPLGRVATVPYLEGVTQDDRTLLVYSQNDLFGALARDNFGQWEHSVFPGGSRQRELAMRLGVNLVMYAICLDYKADQVHIPFILKRRQWKVSPDP